MVSNIASGLRGGLSLTDTATPSAAASSGITIKTISAQVQAMSSKAKALATLMSRLIKSGMPKAFVQEIAGLGIDEATAVAKAILAGTSTQQKQLYKDYAAVTTNTRAVGDIVADQMYNAGIQATQGLIKGLEHDQRSLANAAKRLAKRLETEVKKALGIRSPSRVFAALGRFLPLGIVQGIESTTGAAVSSVSTLADAMTNAFAPDLTAHVGVSGQAPTLSARTRTVGTAEPVGPDGLTARDRALIAAIESITAGAPITINPPPETDTFTLARDISRELEFRGV